MKWAEIPEAVKLTGGVLAVVSVLGGFAYGTFQTLDAAEFQQQTQAAETRAWRLAELERTIKSLQFQLLTPGLTEAQREFLSKEIARLEDQVKCIRSGQC